MKFITKNDEPQEFIDWKVQEKERLNHKYNLDSLSSEAAWNHLLSNMPEFEEDGFIYYTKTKLKETLLSEQGHICAFCMNRLYNDSKCTIDHLIPKTQDLRTYTFDYLNLLAVCSGTVGLENDTIKDDKGRQVKPDKRHCNNKKDDKPVDITPLQDDCESKFTFTNKGEIFGLNDIANKTIAVLGLDSSILVKARNDAIFKFLYPYPQNKMLQINTEDIQQELANIKILKDGKYQPFCVAIEQILKNLLSS